MSDIAKGSARVGSVMTKLSRFGYRCARISASGQRKGSRRTERGVDGDLIAFADPDTGLPHLIVEVGGAKKSVAESMRQMTEYGLPPGFRAIVARCMPTRTWRYHDAQIGVETDLTTFLERLKNE